MEPLIYEFEAPLTRNKATIAIIRMQAEIIEHEAPINDFDQWSVGDVYAIGDLELGGTRRCLLDGLDGLYTTAMVTLCQRSHQDIIDSLWKSHTRAEVVS